MDLSEIEIFKGSYTGFKPEDFYNITYDTLAYMLLPLSSYSEKQMLLSNPNGVPYQFGTWVEGPLHTSRLKTQDPIYGDQFGFTGASYWGVAGEPHSSFFTFTDPALQGCSKNGVQLFRQTGCAWVVSGQSYPITINAAAADSLLVKPLIVRYDGNDQIGIYIVNFGAAPVMFNAIVPVPWKMDTTIWVYDDKAADWEQDRIVYTIGNNNGCLPISLSIPGKSAFQIFINAPGGYNVSDLFN